MWIDKRLNKELFQAQMLYRKGIITPSPNSRPVNGMVMLHSDEELSLIVPITYDFHPHTNSNKAICKIMLIFQMYRNCHSCNL